MTEYTWTEVSVPITLTKPATYHKWVWFWQVGRYKVRGWRVEDRTFLKAKVWRELRLEDYIYGDGNGKLLGLSALINQPLFSGGGISRETTKWWARRTP